MAPKKIGEYNLGIQSFLRLYVYQTRVVKNWGKINLKEAENIASMGRAILGWQTMREIEPFLGFLLTRQLAANYGRRQAMWKRLVCKLFIPHGLLNTVIKLFGQNEAIAFLKEA